MSDKESDMMKSCEDRVDVDVDVDAVEEKHDNVVDYHDSVDDVKTTIEEDGYNIKDLKTICKEYSIRNYSNRSKAELKNMIISHILQKTIKKNVNEVYEHDKYTVELLAKQYSSFKEYVTSIVVDMEETGMSFRIPNMPEYISENIIKFILRSVGHKVVWNGLGELQSSEDGKLEFKCFATSSPCSFSYNRKDTWNKIYFLDSREYLEEDRFILYCVNLSNTSDEWKNIMVNKTDTMESQQKQKKRPRISWDKLYTQIEDHVDIVFDGTFQDIVNNNTDSDNGNEE